MDSSLPSHSQTPSSPSPPHRPPSQLPAPAQRQEELRFPSAMAIVDLHGDKGNVPPPSAATAAAARRHGVAVKKLKLKRLGKERRRVPLRDITNLFLAAAAADATEWGQPLERSSEHVEADFPPVPAPAVSPATATAQNWLAGGAELKPARCSLRKEFR